MSHPKMDPKIVAYSQPHEIYHIVTLMKTKWGITITKEDVLACEEAVGRSRRQVYRYLRQKFGV